MQCPRLQRLSGSAAALAQLAMFGELRSPSRVRSSFVVGGRPPTPPDAGCAGGAWLRVAGGLASSSFLVGATPHSPRMPAASAVRGVALAPVGALATSCGDCRLTLRMSASPSEPWLRGRLPFFAPLVIVLGWDLRGRGPLCRKYRYCQQMGFEADPGQGKWPGRIGAVVPGAKGHLALCATATDLPALRATAPCRYWRRGPQRQRLP